MNKSIFRIAASLTLFVLLKTTVLATTCPSHPTDSVAYVDTTFSISVSIAGDASSRADFDLAQTEDCHVRGEVCVWRTAGGGYEYHLVAESISADPGCDAIDSYSTIELFDMLSVAAVTRAVEIGRSPCGTSQSFNTKVWSVSCVDRTGSGDSTAFATCPPVSFSSRALAVVCLGAGASQVTITGSVIGSSCTTGCEATCQ